VVDELNAMSQVLCSNHRRATIFWFCLRLDPSHLLQFRQAKRGRKSSAASIRSVPPSRRHSGAGGEERTSATADLWSASVDL